MVAAGIGVTRLPLSARTLADSGVAFVPLADETAEVVLLTRAPRRPVVDRVAAVLRELAASTDLTAPADAGRGAQGAREHRHRRVAAVSAITEPPGWVAAPQR